jgi:hypothetical protein
MQFPLYTDLIKSEEIIMKSFLKRAWKEILQGENLDAYLIVIFAISLGVINLLGIIPENWMNNWVVSAILTVLGMMAVISLGNRHRVEELKKEFSKSISNFFIDKWESDGTEEMSLASEIWFLGVSLGRPIGDHYAFLESKLKSGAKIKMLFRDPRNLNGFLKIVTEQEYIPSNPKQVQQNIYKSLARVQSLQKSSPENLEIRVIDYPIPFNIFANDPDKNSGALYIETRSYKMPEGDVPKFALYPKDGYWYEFFKRQLFVFWKNGEPWESENSINIK